MSLVSYASSDSDEDSNSEMLKTTRESGLTVGGERERMAAGRPDFDETVIKPKEPSKPVIITVPSLSEFADIDEEPSLKRSKISKGTGLFSVLPPPKNTLSSTKVVNRPFVPHSVSKQRSTTSTSSPVSAAAPSTAVTDSRQDDALSSTCNDADETGSADFFSLDNLTKDTRPPSSPVHPSAIVAADSSVGDPELSTTAEVVSTTDDRVDDGGLENAPLQFDAAWVSSSNIDVEHSSDMHVSSTDRLAYDVNASYDTEQSDGGSSSMLLADQAALFNDEGFLRMVGKSRHKREDIQIVDVAQADQLPKYDEWLTKALTEDVANRPSRKKGFMPTSQQRRKHQITYLAYQAREREVELKNQWAENRQSKRQTQSKYGF